eukprot:254961-Prymnesium_polylepis.1
MPRAGSTVELRLHAPRLFGTVCTCPRACDRSHKAALTVEHARTQAGRWMHARAARNGEFDS